MNKNSAHTLLLGIGNDILTDDAIGPKLVRKLEADLAIHGLAFHTAAVGGMEIIEYISGYHKVIIIDAIRTKAGIPGTVYHFSPGDFKETLHLSSFHDMNFLTALEFAKKLDLQLPGQIEIIAVEIVEDLTFADHYSPIIEKKYSEICREVATLVEMLIKS